MVEDDDGIRRAIMTVLGRAGYQMREATSGKEASLLWENEESDLESSPISTCPTRAGSS